MNFTTLMMIGENLTSDSPIADRATVGLQVVGIGMGVVFGVLILLIGILQIFKLFAVKKPAENKAQPVEAAPTPVPVASVAPVASATAPVSEEEQIVAIATAAIAASRGESECAFNVISIKKIVK